MTTVTTVAFAKLTAPEAINARGDGPKGKDGIGELAASIEAKGLIQPLAVRPADGKGTRYEVIDGRRRFQALQLLVRDKRMSKSDAVPVIVRNEDDAEALETSLIANTQRLPMHPVDQHQVFARLADQGRSTAEIAGRFGMAERTVRQRLALGRLAPVVAKAWKEGKLDEKAAQAFTIASPEAQEAAFASLKKRGRIDEWSVKSELSGERPSAKGIAQDVLDAYLAAGGTVTVSLFEEDQLIDDPAILKRVRADAKAGTVAALRERLAAEGWGTILLASELDDTSWQWNWDHVLGENADDDAEMTPEEEAEWDRLNDEGREDEADAIHDAADLRRYSPGQRAASCVVIDDRHNDRRPEVARGLLLPAPSDSAARSRPEGADEHPASADGHPKRQQDESEGASEEEHDDTHSISAALTTTITESLTLAAQDTLPADPRLALRCAVAALESTWGPVKLTVSAGFRHQPRSGEFADALAGLDGVSDTELLARFARLVAGALNLVSFGPSNGRHRSPADAAFVAALPAGPYLAAARQRFLADDYFKRVPKALALEALDEMAEAGALPRPQVEALADAKKADIATLAASTAQACGWLPPLLRHPAYALTA